MADCECIDATITEETIEASIVEEVIEATISEEIIEASIVEEVIEATISEEIIEASIVEEVIEVSIEGWSCPPSCDGDGGKVEVDFDFNDVGPSGLIIGGIPDSSNVHSTFLDITEEFDNGLGFTIGTQASQALLMRIDENSPDVVNQYMVANNLALTGTETIRLFSVYAVAPTQGTGRATVYYH
ncbi:MAG: hypothetical protein DRH10_02360 [Deltaproteobacteria bacterium]|nr:MAG: hypothetical protein DRH10_02360 [Deltaproteobacteria bacterium]